MPDEPQDDLERMLADDEATIRDDGFSKRVIDHARPAGPWRRTILYGAGFAGAGFALGGIVQLSSKLPPVATWLPDFTGAMRSADIQAAVQNAYDPTQMAIVAIAAGITVVLAALAIQAR